ncbi:hypothetical protein RC79_06565 [Pectobacterium brasiliense]|nr:hypothetical protein RC79_06565 [Pectobacterium brasiliense]
MDFFTMNQTELKIFLGRSFLTEAKEKCEHEKNKIFLDEKLTEIEILKHVFNDDFRVKNKKLISAHLQALHTQLQKILSPELESTFKIEGLFVEFAKGITIFDHITKTLEMQGGTYGDNRVFSNNFYYDASRAIQKRPHPFYQGDLEIACIPMKLRLAIELYIKNMIGFKGAKKKNRIGKVVNHTVKISELLNFFQDKYFIKYVNLPVSIDTLKVINTWSNKFIHSGVIPLPWQSLTAIDMLYPLFNIWRDDKEFSLNGFNFINLNHSQDEMLKDLNLFLSEKSKSIITVELSPRCERPFEGVYANRPKPIGHE